MEGRSGVKGARFWRGEANPTRLRSFTDKEGHFWLEQNASKDSKWAKLAREGHEVERLTRENCPAAWNQLRVWIDQNHNGVSEADELHTLDDLGIRGISLRYSESPLTDQWGNQFRYGSGIEDAEGPKANRCYDVFLAK